MCSADIKKYDCHNQVAVGVNDGTDVVGLSSVLLCLENKKLNGSKSSAKSPCTTILILIVTQQFAYYLTLYTLLTCIPAFVTTEQVSRGCIEELADFREMLIEDFSLSPEITHLCAPEIKGFCQHEVKKEAGTLHCLMDNKEELSEKCMASVSCFRATFT